MPDSTRVLTALRNDLAGAAGLLRRPNDATPSAAPPAHIEPEGGAPAPLEREAPEDDATLVVTLRLSADTPTAPGRRAVGVDVIYRSRTTRGLMRARALDAAIRARLVDGSSYGQGITLDEGGPASTFALEVSAFAGIGPVSEEGGVRTERASYTVEVLAG